MWHFRGIFVAGTYMMILIMLSVSHDADINSSSDVSGIISQKRHVVNPFNCLELRNIMVPLMIPLASCDADTSDNGIT